MRFFSRRSLRIPHSAFCAHFSLCILHSALCILLASCLTGCALVGVAASKIAGPPKTPAAYVPVKDEMLVVAENFRNPASVSLVSEQLDRQIAHELIEHKIAPIMNPDLLMDLRHKNEQAYSSMEIAAIGKAVGAKQVLYADIIDFTMEPALGASMVRGRAEVRIRVVDVATGQTRWPSDVSAGYPITLQTPFIALRDGLSEGAVQQQVTQTLADKVAKLFYESQADDVDVSPPDIAL